jgi:hypothetical protein
VGRTSVEAVGEVVEAVGEDLAALDEAMVAEAWRRMWRSGHVWRGPSGGRQGANGGPDRRLVRRSMR